MLLALHGQWFRPDPWQCNRQFLVMVVALSLTEEQICPLRVLVYLESKELTG